MIGIARTIARVTGPQWTRRSSRSTNSPSENRVRISASSIRWTTAESVASTETTSVAARPIPSATESTEIESTVPRITPDSAAATASSAAEEQDRLAEADIHAWAYSRFRGRPAGGTSPGSDRRRARSGMRRSPWPGIGPLLAIGGGRGGERPQMGHRVGAQQAARERRSLDAGREPDRAAAADGELARRMEGNRAAVVEVRRQGRVHPRRADVKRPGGVVLDRDPPATRRQRQRLRGGRAALDRGARGPGAADHGRRREDRSRAPATEAPRSAARAIERLAGPVPLGQDAPLAHRSRSLPEHEIRGLAERLERGGWPARIGGTRGDHVREAAERRRSHRVEVELPEHVLEPQVWANVVRVVVVANSCERPRAPQLVGDEVVTAEEQHLAPLDQRPQLGELVGVVLRGHGRLAQDQEAGHGDAPCERERERRAPGERSTGLV